VWLPRLFARWGVLQHPIFYAKGIESLSQLLPLDDKAKKSMRVQIFATKSLTNISQEMGRPIL